MRLFHTPLMQLSGTASEPLDSCASVGTQAWRALTQERTSKLMLFRIEQEPDLSASKAHLQCYITLCLKDTPDSFCLTPPKQFEHMVVASRLIRLSMTAVRFWPWRLAVATVFVFLPLAWVDILRRRRIYSFVFQPFVITRANQASKASNNTVTNTQKH